MKDYLNKQFNHLFNRHDGISYFSPARVNLIGEHIDYNGGLVFPCALSFGTYGIIGRRDDAYVHVYSDTFSKSPYVFSIKSLIKDDEHSWADYIKGVLDSLEKRNYTIHYGFDLYIHGNMPYGAGLSSSASLESLIITMINDLYRLNLTLKEKALIGKDAENVFVGVKSGIMDQFAVLFGKKDYAILLNTETLNYSYVPIMLNDFKLIIVNTHKNRGLADSKYNIRFNECREALNLLKPIYLIENLCELKPSSLKMIQSILPNTLYRRVRHVITEQQRTIDATLALKENDLKKFCELLNDSHNSLKNDYDVTGTELDTLQSLLITHGALGARMTGAGFGGCCIAIVHQDLFENMRINVTKEYEKIIGHSPSFYEAIPSNGTEMIE